MKTKASILIVEDDPNIRETLNTILQRRGYLTDTARTGGEAIEKSQTNLYNVMLLDIKLPDMEGTSVLRRMHETQPRMIKIMVTGYPSLENSVAALNLGADAYVIKPVSPDKLLVLIEEKLAEQTQTTKMTEEGVTRWIKMRVRSMENNLQRGHSAFKSLRPGRRRARSWNKTATSEDPESGHL
jgi:two-component system phosphate regulon sensor histidine kinase PhoR